jgi:hypothetical protein
MVSNYTSIQMGSQLPLTLHNLSLSTPSRPSLSTSRETDRVYYSREMPKIADKEIFLGEVDHPETKTPLSAHAKIVEKFLSNGKDTGIFSYSEKKGQREESHQDLLELRGSLNLKIPKKKARDVISGKQFKILDAPDGPRGDEDTLSQRVGFLGRDLYVTLGYGNDWDVHCVKGDELSDIFSTPVGTLALKVNTLRVLNSLKSVAVGTADGLRVFDASLINTTYEPISGDVMHCADKAGVIVTAERESSSSIASAIRLYDPKKSFSVFNLNTDSEITCLSVSDDSRYVLSGDNLGQVKVWDIRFLENNRKKGWSSESLGTFSCGSSSITALSADKKGIVRAGTRGVQATILSFDMHEENAKITSISDCMNGTVSSLTNLSLGDGSFPLASYYSSSRLEKPLGFLGIDSKMDPTAVSSINNCQGVFSLAASDSVNGSTRVAALTCNESIVVVDVEGKGPSFLNKKDKKGFNVLKNTPGLVIR